jgi:hypothetical protein
MRDLIVWHGTDKESAIAIKQRGMRPGGYVTPDRKTAEEYAKWAASHTNTTGAIIKIKLSPDHPARRDEDAEIVGQRAFQLTAPVSASRISEPIFLHYSYGQPLSVQAIRNHHWMNEAARPSSIQNGTWHQDRVQQMRER